MLTVTEAAGAHLAELLAESKTPEARDLVVRIVYEADGLALTLDQTRADDQTFDHEGVTVLVVDEKLSEALAGRTLDIAETETGQRLTMR